MSATPIGAFTGLKPVVKLFTPDVQCTWLLTELGPDGSVSASKPDFGYVSLIEP